MASPSKTPLDERVTALRIEIDKFIDDRVAELRKIYTGLPDAVVRRSITRGMGCQCASYLELKAGDDKAAAKGAA